MDEHLFIRFCWLVGFLLREKVLSDTLALFVYVLFTLMHCFLALDIILPIPLPPPKKRKRKEDMYTVIIDSLSPYYCLYLAS